MAAGAWLEVVGHDEGAARTALQEEEACAWQEVVGEHGEGVVDATLREEAACA